MENTLRTKIKMKHTIFLLCFAWIANIAFAQEVSYPNLQLSPAYPQAGQTIEITYKPTKDLRGAKSITCEVFFGKESKVFDNWNGKYDNLILSEFALVQSNGIWKGSLQIPKEAQSIVFAFSNEETEKRDTNDKEWYTSLIYNQKQPTSNAYGSLASLFVDWHWSVNKKDNSNMPKALQLLEKEFVLNPTNKRKLLRPYFQVLRAIEKGKADSIILAELENLEKQTELNENDLSLLAYQYKKLKQESKMNKYTELCLQKYPQSNFAVDIALDTLSLQRDYLNRKIQVEKFVKKFPKPEYLDRFVLSWALEVDSVKEAETILQKAIQENKSERGLASCYYLISQYLLNKNQDMDKMLDYATKTRQLAKNFLDKPIDKNTIPFYETERSYRTQNTTFYAYCLQLLGNALSKQAKDQEALSYFKEASAITKGKSPEFNESYVLCLSKVKDNTTLRPELERFISKGKATPKMKDLFKELYIKEKGNEEGYETYLASLQQNFLDQTKEELKKKLIKETAPTFALKNLKGETVSLAGLKGKVVILDFWATWCGPCIASFPGMQKAVDKYKDDKNVVFLFIDTWEKVQDKPKKVADFIAQKGYTFNVLLDLEDKVVKDFGVSGIPTKFIIDGEGNIRFKSVGGGGGDMVAEEIKIMVDLIREMTN